MIRLLSRTFSIGLALIMAGLLGACNSANATTPFADPSVDNSLASQSGQQTAVLSGGCFWGMQLLFEHVKGVISVTAGYSGGSASTAQYEIVSDGGTGHAESVRITFDPSKVTYGQLLKVFFSVGHDPTELNRQGPDEGTQYRSVIFYSGDDQLRIARAYVDQLDQARTFSHKIVTQLTPLAAFYPAEAYHQDYAIHNPYNPYIMINDLPKVDHLRKELPDLYVKNRIRLAALGR
jgi:peptide-methionine (S)-S-oxide reductase